MSIESNELLKYLGEIAEKSFKGKIPWNQPNPSTFQWLKSDDNNQFQVTIQRASKPRARTLAAMGTGSLEENYLFQVHDRKKKQTVVSLSSQERPEVRRILSKIFHGAEKGIDVISSNVLRKLLENND